MRDELGQDAAEKEMVPESGRGVQDDDRTLVPLRTKLEVASANDTGWLTAYPVHHTATTSTG